MTAQAKLPVRAWAVDFVLLAAIWGASFLFMHVATVEFGPLPTAALRVSVGAAALLPLMLARGHGPLFLRHWRPVVIVGLLNSGIPFALYAFALLSISTGLSAILNATVPLFGAIVAWLWLGDKLNRSRVLGLVIGFLGVALLAWDKASFKPDASGLAPGWAVLACLGATVCYAIAGSFTKRFLSGMPPIMTAAGSQIGACLGLALPSLWLWPAQTPSLKAWGALLLVGLACTALAYFLFFRLIEHAGPARALAVTFLVPVFAVLYGALFLGEAVTPYMLVCGGVVVCGTALATGMLRLGRAG